jgi:hypothetical protein
VQRNSDQHAPKEAKVFWFFFSKKNILSFQPDAVGWVSEALPITRSGGKRWVTLRSPTLQVIDHFVISDVVSVNHVLPC